MIKFLRKRISESEFRSALMECSKTAQKAYEKTLDYKNQVEDILNGLNTELGEKVSRLLNDTDAKNFPFSSILKDIVSEIGKSSHKGLLDLANALDIKRDHLKDFTIALFGRTKAGKSTIQEALTKGDGSTIGTGSQRTTRDVREYSWKGLRLIDTPGVEAYEGNVDAEKAIDVIDQSDMVIFLTSDDSVQPGEFDAMERLLEINKHFFIILNVKDDVGHKMEETSDGKKRFKLVNLYGFKRFLEKPDKIFDQQRLMEHQAHIKTYVKNEFGARKVDIVWIHALAAFLSTREEDEYTKHSEKLWQLSQMEKVYGRIASEVNDRGKQRRILTFFDGIIYFVNTITKMIDNKRRELKPQAMFTKNKRTELKNSFDKFIQENNLKIERKCEYLFDSFKACIPSFVDDYIGKDSAQFALRDRMYEEKEKIEKTMNSLIEEIVKDLQDRLAEFTREFQYDIETIKLEPPEIGEFKKGQMGRIFKWTGVSAGAISSVALGVAYFAAVNSWNPVGWVAGGIGGVCGVLGWLLGKREENKWLKAKGEAVQKIWSSIDEDKQKTQKSYKSWFNENITTKGRKAMLDQVSIYIDSLFEIIDDLREYTLKLEELETTINEELFAWLFHVEGLRCGRDDILSVARVQGEAAKIMVKDGLKIDPEAKNRLNALCGERVSLFNHTDNIPERVARSLYPAKPQLGQIKIHRHDGRIVAQVKVSNEEKGRYIGKNGINIRLSKKVCGIERIEII